MIPRHRLIVAAVAIAFLAGAVGYVLGGRETHPGRDSVDVGFLFDMIAHHEQALEMASLELSNGSEQRVLHFAREITQQQSYEIGVMEQILRRWGDDPDDPPETAMGWMGMAPMPAAEMPGMATEEQLSALSDAQGRDADGLFLDLMRTHHDGGADMAAFAAGRARDPQVEDLARRMAKVQRVEINEMNAAAVELGVGSPVAPPAPKHHH